MAATTRTVSNDSVVHNRGTKVFKAIIAMEIGTDDLVTTGDMVPLMELPPEAIVTSIKSMNDDLDAAGPTLVVDIGIWKAKKGISLDDLLANEANAEALDQDIYTDGSTTFQAAVTALAEIIGGTNAVDINDRFSTVRVLGGVSIGEDPFKYILGFKVATNATTPAAGGILMEIEYVQG